MPFVEPILLMVMILGVIAGNITTITGFGGGLVLVVCFAAVWDPLSALALTSIALLIGNSHRVYLFRHSIDRSVVVPFVIGALPGSIIGALVAVSLPSWLIQIMILVGVGLAYLRALGRFAWNVPSRAFVPAGAGIGVLAATTGGAGLLQGPLFLSAGLSGDVLIASMSCTAVFIHIGRIVGYASGGLIGAEMLTLSIVLTVSVVAGNLMGHRLTRGMSAGRRTAVELASLTLCATVGIVGLLG